MVPLPKWSLQCMKPHPDPEPEWWQGAGGLPEGAGLPEGGRGQPQSGAVGCGGGYQKR